MNIDRVKSWRTKDLSTMHCVLRKGNKVSDFITCCVDTISCNSLQQIPQEVQKLILINEQ